MTDIRDSSRLIPEANAKRMQAERCRVVLGGQGGQRAAVRLADDVMEREEAAESA